MSFRRSGANNQNSFLKNLPFGLGYSDINQSKITELPTIPLPVNNPITKKERTVAVTFINFNNATKNGSFYTGAADNSVDETSVNDDGIERYSDRYLKKRKIGTSIDDHPYHLPLFPTELYNVMGINKRKLVKIRKFHINANDVFTGLVDDEKLGLSMLEKLKQLAEDVDNEDEAGNKDENKGPEEAISDNDFDDEEDEDNDDYNAEKYFDGGDDDDDFGGEEGYGDEPAF